MHNVRVNSAGVGQLFIAGLLLLVLFGGCVEREKEGAAGDDRAPTLSDTTRAGLVILESPHSLDTTYARLERALTASEPISIMARVDHAANAKTVDRSLRPTRLLVFGNPKLGTPLMEARATTAIDLPQKMVVWADSSGQVHVAYNDPQYLAERHGIAGRNEELATISKALDKLVRKATATP